MLMWLQEKEESRLTLPGDHEEIIARVLLFLYTGDYDDRRPPTFGIAKPSVSMTSRSSIAAAESGNGAVAQISRNITSNAEKSMFEGTTLPNQDKYDESCDDDSDDGNGNDLVSAMEINAHVYICADKFGLPKLKEHAANTYMLRFQGLEKKDLLELPYSSIRLVYENTDVTDHHLRRAITRYCIKYYNFVGPEIHALVAQHENTAWTLAMELQRQRRDEKWVLHNRIR
jgi:hypothetical protein